MKTRMFIFTLATALVGLLAFSVGTLAARPPGAGNGSGDDGGTEPPDYGDLIILYRDAYGVPILDINQCQQPIAFPSDTCSVVGLVPVDPDTCAVVAEFATCTQEVDFGRINSARAPDSVLESQLEDVVVTLATADCISLDPAGRLVASRVADGVVSTKTIDSPLQNLAIYRQLMLTGYLGDAASPIELPAATLDTAARGLGVASDKTGEVNVDLVVYLNQIMGLTDLETPTILGKICIDVTEEVMGTVQPVTKCFLNYGPGPSDFPPVGANYLYTRSDNFSTTADSLPLPAYIPDATAFGWFEYLALVDPPITDENLFEILQGSILDTVFGDDPGFTEGNIGGFAQAADDTRAVINFMHDWPVPDADEYGTPVPCEADPNLIAYDVSISEESGLQVPAQMVDDSEGREFIVTVANASASTDPATGTVTVTAIAENDGSIYGSPWVFPFADLAAGASESWITFFTIDLGQETTINWEAVAYAPGDVNTANNTVTATTSVTMTGGGGGGRGGGGRP